MNIKYLVLLVVVALVFFVGLLGSFSLNSLFFFHPSSEAKVKVGVILPLTGVSSDGGDYARKGLLLAQKEIDSNSSIQNKIDLIFEDSQFKSEVAISSLNKLISVDGVRFVVGDYGSGQTLAIASVAEENKVVLITPASQADSVSLAGDYIFRTEISAKDEAKFFAEWLFEKYGSKKIGVFECIQDYCSSFDNTFLPEYASLGGNPVNVYKYEMTQSDFKDSLLKSKFSGDDILLLLGNSKSIALIMKQARELGLSSFFVSTSPVQRQTLIDVGGAAAEGLVYSYAYDENSRNFAIRNYKSKYFLEYGVANEAVSAKAYDALMLLSYCFEKVGTNSMRVKNCLYQVKDYSGASGAISFDSNGDIIRRQFFLKTVKNGKFVPYEAS